MKKKLIGHSAFCGSVASVTLLLCTAACLILTGTLLAFLRPETSANASQRTLTFAERVAYQRAIEDVYWRHRIWPKENSSAKPPLDAVMPQSQLEKKVSDYLRKSQALEDYWHRPITSEQLQAEMDRMAKHTRQPEVLRELFEALGNDPFVIAECLARPALAERLLENWYAYDERIHGELKQRCEAELQAHLSIGQMKQMSGKYSEIEFAKDDRSDAVGHAHRLSNQYLADGAPSLQQQNSAHTVDLNAREWDETVQTLVTIFGVPRDLANLQSADMAAHPKTIASEKSEIILIDKLSASQEDEAHFYTAAVIEKNDNRLKIATVTWSKQSLESWLAMTEDRVRVAGTETVASYNLPKIAGGACIDNTWTPMASAPDAREAHTAVWTGTEMIVWGGLRAVGVFNAGGRYNPSTDTWIPTSTENAPTARDGHSAVWTGTEMIVWGGSDDTNASSTGGRYNPITDNWVSTSTLNAPDGRSVHTAVWTGSHMIVWGGEDANSLLLDTGGRYDPSTDSWTATTTSNAPVARVGHSAVWTGSVMIIWGGYDGSGFDGELNTGGRYNPATNSWTATSTASAPDHRAWHTAVWTGTEMIVWGGYNSPVGNLNSGGRYNPNTNTWTATSTLNAPASRYSHTAVWTGNQMIVWGGNALNTGGRYDATTDSWTATSVINAPSARSGHSATWAGTEMIVWGGNDGTNDLNTGGRYSPGTDSWTATNAGDAPRDRYQHTAIWTGSEMIVWGGRTRSFPYQNTGGRYIAGTDIWTPTSTANVPSGRIWHTAVWTGTEMIVWGGLAQSSDTNSGGRYNPASDSWASTSTANAPSARDTHTAVWVNGEMIVWGGYFSDGDQYLNTGGRYNSITDTWTATTTNNAPPARAWHTAVWTGNEMVVWGGYFFDGIDHWLDTGGKYNPGANSWTATSITNSPTPRESHRAVWTGNEMIVWGGANNTGPLNTGSKYIPNTDSWAAISANNAPTGRSSHTAVWTGSEMIVWGGYDGLNNLNTGGRYNLDTNSWTATSTANGLAGRTRHTAVWTDSEMIVWGGLLFVNVGTNTGGRYCAQTGPPPTPTATATGSATPTATATSTGTPTATPTPSSTVTGTPSGTPRVTPTARPLSTARARPTPPPHITPVPPPPSPRPTAWPRPTSPPHLTPPPSPSSPRPTLRPRPSL